MTAGTRFFAHWQWQAPPPEGQNFKTSANMFASILWQPGPGGTACQMGIPYQCSNVSASRALHQPCQATGLSSACATPAGIDLPARGNGRVD